MRKRFTLLIVALLLAVGLAVAQTSGSYDTSSQQSGMSGNAGATQGTNQSGTTTIADQNTGAQPDLRATTSPNQNTGTKKKKKKKKNKKHKKSNNTGKTTGTTGTSNGTTTGGTGTGTEQH